MDATRWPQSPDNFFLTERFDEEPCTCAAQLAFCSALSELNALSCMRHTWDSRKLFSPLPTRAGEFDEGLDELSDLGELGEDVDWLVQNTQVASQEPLQKKRRRRQAGSIYRWEPRCCEFLQGLIEDLGDELRDDGRGNYGLLVRKWTQQKLRAPRKQIPSQNALMQHLGLRQHAGKTHQCAVAYDPYRSAARKRAK